MLPCPTSISDGTLHTLNALNSVIRFVSCIILHHSIVITVRDISLSVDTRVFTLWCWNFSFGSQKHLALYTYVGNKFGAACGASTGSDVRLCNFSLLWVLREVHKLTVILMLVCSWIGNRSYILIFLWVSLVLNGWPRHNGWYGTKLEENTAFVKTFGLCL
jgi:hypothetical protein